MSWRSPIRGYAHVWEAAGTAFNAHGQPVRIITLREAIKVDDAEVPILFAHNTRRRPFRGALDIWSDPHGMAFEFTPSTDPANFSLVAGITDQRYSQCSWGVDASCISLAADGTTVVVEDGVLREISITPLGGCPGAVCWSSAVPALQLPAVARDALPRWRNGQSNRKTWNCHRELTYVA